MRVWLALALLCVWGTKATADDAFENGVRPLLMRHCIGCHGPDKQKGGLRLDSKADWQKGGDSGAAIKPGQPDASLVIKAIHGKNGFQRMPPKGELSSREIAILTEWIRDGAIDPRDGGPEKLGGLTAEEARKWWAFQPVQRSDVPKSGFSNHVDAFIAAKLASQKLTFSPAADKRTLIRRATYDLIGLPPTPKEVQSFLEDKSPDAFAKVVDRLLQSPHYGERWGRHWLDVVRYADTAGDTADYPLSEAWRYRNYVIDSFNADKPYDQFLREQIAGDILARKGPKERYAEQVTATGYLALSRRFGFDSENYHHLTIQDSIDTLGQSILGLTTGCARCHDHKFDPVTIRDYYGLYGIFASTRYAFPGSEQKTRYRALAPLAPVEESQAKWRDMQMGFASLGMTPASVLRSLDDMDGDFEMQRFAAGGSYGVLVPPWLYEGKVAVTQAAQSPFRHLYLFGNVGASVASGSGAYSIRQAFQPLRTRGVVYVNVEFRAATNDRLALGRHHFVLGRHGRTPAVEIFISKEKLTIPGGAEPLVIPLPKPGEWHCLQLSLDLDVGAFSGSMGIPGKTTVIATKSLIGDWKSGINFVALDSGGTPSDPLPALEIDNIGVQTEPIPPVSVSPTVRPGAAPTLAALKAELQSLVGPDGDLEGQTKGAAPTDPFHPGPASAVKISAASQSPFTNIYPAGTQGIHMPATASKAYNGFGNRLAKPWKAATTGRVHGSFDFRCQQERESTAPGTWRFHIGHSHTSAAAEFGFNAKEFFRRSGNSRDVVTQLQPGEWYQVQFVMDLKTKTFTGSIGTRTKRTTFAGDFAPGWVGSIDYFFIDSGGHVAGAKPALDVDNFMFADAPIPPPDGPEFRADGDPRLKNQAKIKALRQQIEQHTTEPKTRRRELDAQLANGPVALAYGVSEGTPHNARLQLRGEPEKLGAEVPRGFIKFLGNAELPADIEGSGRLELAQWLTRPDNPLTARVMVNRIWQNHFGRGLVKTPNDFGTRSEPPTHPELLDYLATQFVQNGWSVKAMHRLILLSATWQQGGVTADTKPGAVAAYAAFPRRRLSAEEIRDSILAVSGALDSVPGEAHPFPPAYTWGYTQHAPFSAVYDHDKRSVYLMVQRIKRHPFLALFDGADPNSSTAERRVTTVPTQALYFLNDPFVHAKSLKFADRLQAAGLDEEQQIELATRLAFGRPPTADERAEVIEFLAVYRAELKASGSRSPGMAALAAYARTLFGSNEFLHCD